MRNRPVYGQSSVDNALVLIHILRDQGIVTVSQAAELLGVARSTAHRLLAMLVYRDFAVENDDHKYLAGPALFVSAVERRPTGDLCTFLRPLMQSLCAETGETVQVAVRTGRWVRFIATTESAQSVRVGDRRGIAMPARLTAVGRAVLAQLPPASVQQLYNAPGNDSEACLKPGAWRRLVQDLNLTRSQGFAVNLQDTEEGLVAVGVALRDVHDGVHAAMSIAAPAPRLTPDRVQLLGSQLRARCAEVRLPFDLSENSGPLLAR